ncbi:hypothetical protein Dsin_014835 [Dipteronia sinensis]|uniref:DUF382 domain-containing protein n=1 Tax=Dipteronia sinensis TaxID=43782 RepID=A0AAE0AND5_9ROSI|nr:hypothetical protein Dsin_014835 [Dipteronia sinensis]
MDSSTTSNAASGQSATIKNMSSKCCNHFLKTQIIDTTAKELERLSFAHTKPSNPSLSSSDSTIFQQDSGSKTWFGSGWKSRCKKCNKKHIEILLLCQGIGVRRRNSCRGSVELMRSNHSSFLNSLPQQELRKLDRLTSKKRTVIKKLKQKQREPKMGKMDIDYQILHDAFFKYQTKPKLTNHGDLYHEGKEFEVNLTEMKKPAGTLSHSGDLEENGM